MKKSKFKGEHTILDTDVCQFSYEDYVEYCEEEGLTADDEHSEAFWDWCYEERDVNYDADMENIKYCKEYKSKVRVNGGLGLWDGKHRLDEVICDSVYDAIEKIMDADYDHIVRAKWHDGIIEVTESHHDGTNYFVITPYDRRKKFSYLYGI